MAKPNLDEKNFEQLEKDNEVLQNRVDELEAELAKLPTEEEYADLQRQHGELHAQLNSEEQAELQRLADQGKTYIELVRTEAKEAFKTKLMSDGVSRADVDEHPEYLSHCRDVDEIDDIKMLYRSAQSNYRSARSNRKAGRISKELNDYTTATQGKKTRFSRGANDAR